MLWVLQTGAAWRFLPDKYPSPATCWRQLKQWEQNVWLDAWQALLGALDGEGLLKWEETFLDGSFAPAKKGAPPSVKPSVAWARSGWYWSTVAVFRWEVGSKVPLREKLCLRRPRSPKSKSLDPRPPAAKAKTHHRRPRLRLQSAARAAGKARQHSCSMSHQQPSQANSTWHGNRAQQEESARTSHPRTGLGDLPGSFSRGYTIVMQYSIRSQTDARRVKGARYITVSLANQP
jgi:hypothetical protein